MPNLNPSMLDLSRLGSVSLANGRIRQNVVVLPPLVCPSPPNPSEKNLTSCQFPPYPCRWGRLPFPVSHLQSNLHGLPHGALRVRLEIPLP